MAPRGRGVGVRIFGLYAGVVGWLTWPLAWYAASRVPHTRSIASVDVLQAAWALAWESHALVTEPGRVLDANIYHPATHTLFFVQTYLGALPLFAPVFWATDNPTLAINAVFLAGLVLTAAALHWVVWRWTGSHAAGAVAGATFLLSRWTIWWFVPTAPPYAMLWPLPLLVWVVATPAGSWREAWRIVPLVVLPCLTDFVYVAGGVLGTLGTIAAVRAARASTRAAGLRLFAALGLALVLLAPFYAAYQDVRWREPGLAGQSAWLRLNPPTKIPLGLVDEDSWPLSVPLLVWPLVVAGAVRRARRRTDADAPADVPRQAWMHAAAWLGLGIAIAMETALLPGVGSIHLPHYALLHWLGFGAMIRITSRAAVGALVGTAILAGLAFAECVRGIETRSRWTGIGLATVVVVLFYTECRAGWFQSLSPRTPLPAAYPLEEPPGASEVTEALRATDGVVLELPLLGNGVAPAPHARAMFRSIFHWRPLVNGYGSYYPAGFRERMQLALRLPDPAALAALQAETGLTHVLLEVADPWHSLAGAIWMRASKEGQVRFVGQTGRTFLFEVPDNHARAPAAPGTTR